MKEFLKKVNWGELNACMVVSLTVFMLICKAYEPSVKETTISKEAETVESEQQPLYGTVECVSMVAVEVALQSGG